MRPCGFSIAAQSSIPSSPALIEPAAKLTQPLHILDYLVLGYFLPLCITDPHLMKLIRPVHSQIISLQLLFLLRYVKPIPSAVERKVSLISVLYGTTFY